jgi:hypothetical protein
MKWWGWGDPERRLDLPPGAVGALREELGVKPEDAVEPVSLDQVSLPERRPIPEAVLNAAGEVLDGAEERLRRAAGRSYPDLVRLRTGQLEVAPDAVLRPADAAAVEAVLTACSENGVAVVPYGGGTSVVGGIDAVAGDHNATSSGCARSSSTRRRSPPPSGPASRVPTRRRRCRRAGPRSATSRSPSSRRPSAGSPPPAPPGRPRAAMSDSTRS